MFIVDLIFFVCFSQARIVTFVSLQLGTLCLLLSSTVTLSLFKSRLKTHWFNTAYLFHQRLWSYGTLQMYYYYYYLLFYYRCCVYDICWTIIL